MRRILFLIILVILFTGCGYDPYKMPKDVYINLNENVFEVYENHYSKELISDSNVEILDNELLYNEKLGTYKYTINYKYKKRKYKYDVEYSIVDNTSPIMIKQASNITLKLDSEDNLCSYIAYGDNYDSNPRCDIEGEYDLSKIGIYDLEYVITDSSNNELRKKFKLNVVKKISSKTNSKPKYVYIDDIMKYKTDNTSIGIDVSKWQGNIDFNKVKEAGIEFVIMRVGYQTDANEEFIVDQKFDTYYKEAKQAGLKIGVYVYTIATSKEAGIKTARFVLDKLNNDKLDFPIAYDWESWKYFNEFKISLHTLNDAYLEFEKELKNNGYEAMLYSSKYYLENNIWNVSEDYNIWLAHYIDETNYKGNYVLWQMTSSAKIDGISDNTVDIDILYKK